MGILQFQNLNINSVNDLKYETGLESIRENLSSQSTNKSQEINVRT